MVFISIPFKCNQKNILLEYHFEQVRENSFFVYILLPNSQVNIEDLH